MGRRICPESSDRALPIPNSAAPRRSRRAPRALPLLGLLILLFASAFSSNSRAAEAVAASSDEPAKMFVEANELIYNDKTNVVTAEGNARVYYKGRTLEADRIIYDRNTKRVYAEGHAKQTEKDGTILHGDRFDMTDDFRDGFIESLRADSTDKTHFSSPHMERTEGETSVYDKGTYTACDACKNDPTKPPLWRVRAKRIIHKDEEHMIYYEDAWLEFFGVPLAYVPYLSTPDPTVKRKSGLLMPRLVVESRLGTGGGVPIFWDLADNYDLTVTPNYFSKQGFFGQAEWRHRLDSGSYFVRVSGIEQRDPSVFGAEPYGSGDHKFRGSAESKGEFQIADQWKFGWAGILLSDKRYLTDYGVRAEEYSNNYISETTSTIYLNGQGNRGYFDLRGYYFEGLSTHDFQAQQAIAHPVWDYNKSFDIDPEKTAGIGGQVTLDFNLTSLSASAATYQAVGRQTLDNAYNLYNVCTNYVRGQTTDTCLLRGIGGNYTRATVDTSWKRQFIDPIGEVWTPFVFARANGEFLGLNTSNSYTFSSVNGSSSFSNASQGNFLGTGSSSDYGMFTPGVGLEYRYPMLAKTPIGSVVFEPIGQIIVRPNNNFGSTSLVNMDAQSLVFDDTNLFQWNKYSGYDRFETGTRANYGAQITTNFVTGGYANLLVGQSYQVAGTNSYATADAANVGLSSGLDTRRSDYVSSFTLAPNSIFALTAKGRFDVDTFEARRVDVGVSTNLGALTGSVSYANYEAQPVIGYYVRREGLALNSKYNVTDNYFVQGNVTFDMSRHLYPIALTGYTTPSLFSIANLGIGAGYHDECCTLTANFSSNYYDNGTGSLSHTNIFLLELQLRTLGDFKFSQTLSSIAGLDGL